jgi:hypothetical protein
VQVTAALQTRKFLQCLPQSEKLGKNILGSPQKGVLELYSLIHPLFRERGFKPPQILIPAPSPSFLTSPPSKLWELLLEPGEIVCLRTRLHHRTLVYPR